MVLNDFAIKTVTYKVQRKITKQNLWLDRIACLNLCLMVGEDTVLDILLDEEHLS